ncbi:MULTISPECIES: RebB family R body protein [Burkholderia]|uniref:Killing trait family protein n=2 Tax=Burkholderia TaxID=32008 RepID=A0ABR5THL1_9BURK|nr:MULTISPECIES: RebB family R body protein [Burkholderia]AOK48427.1 killing trait family protein [Burkholderia sp. MSMB617WGS]AOJ70321.1 killing trait family protein [Burkholderia savannae]AOJ82282.1 killing trait family protein [Burkholderia savannae]KGS01610.1 killing trait family protein [Burkholderia sp. ABCPW 111]KVG38750.1 killing trait family protein [Burkholderia sp. MSMB0265]
MPELAVGQTAAVAMAMTYLAMADSLGIAMSNAVANQQRGQVIAGAATTQVLALIIAKGSQQGS